MWSEKMNLIRARYFHTRYLGSKRCISLGTWCNLKRAYCKKYNLYPIHRRGPHRLVKNVDVVLVAEIRRNKTIALEYKALGAKIVGIDHGLTDGRLEHPGWRDAVSYCDVYAVRGDRTHWFRPPPDIEEVVYAKMYTLKDSFNVWSDPGKYVYLMGFPFKPSYGNIPEWLPYFNTELQTALHQQIIDCLEKHKVEWKYKIHPLRIKETLEQLKIPKSRIVKTVFEKCHRKASVLIHTTCDSTTFGYTLCCNKPIILFNHPNTPWKPGALYELQNSKVDDVTAISFEFNEKEFMGVLNEKNNVHWKGIRVKKLYKGV